MENSRVSLKIDVLVAEIGSTTTVVNAFHDINTNNPIFWVKVKLQQQCLKVAM